MPINTTYQFTTVGDYVNFYVDNNLTFKLSKDSNIVAWYFDDEPGIIFKVNGGTYFTGQPEDISFDGVPLGSKEGFVTAIKAMFPVYAGGGGSTPGIDTVLAQDQDFTAERNIELAGNDLNIKENNEEIARFGLDSAVFSKRLRAVNLQTFADNAAALSGGLDSGDLYIRVSHGLDIVTD